MIDYTHAIGGERNEGVADTLNKLLSDDNTILSDRAAEGAEIDTEAFQNLCRTNPHDVLASADIDQLQGGDKKRIRDLRTSDDGKLVNIKVQVDFVSETFSLPSEITFACKKCGERQVVDQDTKTEHRDDPSICIGDGCRSQQFVEYEKTLVDKQIARVSDLPQGKEQAESALVHLYGNRIGTVSSGDTLTVSGLVQHVQTSPNQNETKTERELVITHIENQDADEVELSDEDIEWIESLNNPVETLVASIAPHLVGITDKKRGTLHALASGHEAEIEDLRTNSHILHIGDPSTGKSDLISWLNNILPNSIYAAAESATGVGLTATVEREERLGGKWVCHAGTLVKANEGHAFVDELGEFSEDNLNKLRTALSEGEVVLNKASIQNRHLPASTRLIGSANP
jgi:replicative DNA helicase Mcm